MEMPFRDAVVFGAAGGFGSLFRRCLENAAVNVAGFDLSSSAGLVHGDVEAPNQEMVRALGIADIALLCVPDASSARALPRLFSLARPACLFIEVCSVMRDYRHAAAEAGVSLVLINPLFAPDLGFCRRPIATSVETNNGNEGYFIRLIEDWGADVVAITRDEHNHLAALNQALVHVALLSVALTLARAATKNDGRVMPPPGTLMSMLACRILSGTQKTYWDIQTGNPFAAQIRQELSHSLQELNFSFDGCAPDRFAALWSEAAAGFGQELGPMAADCARIFHRMMDRPETEGAR
jgi:prephenate dehydrogenase